MKLRRSGMPLLDKITLYNFVVDDVLDLNALQKKGFLSVLENAQTYIYTDSGEKYSKISINNDPEKMFDKFIYGINPKTRQTYGTLQLSVPNDGYHNLNCLTMAEYKSRIEIVKDHLATAYGILVDFTGLKFKKIEINETIELDAEFRKYFRPISLMMFLLPGRLRLHGENDHSGKDKHGAKTTDYERNKETFEKTSGRRGLTIKIYDKSNQLEKKHRLHVDSNYLRFEITLNSNTKIERVFGTNLVSKITDEDIYNYFRTFVQENLIDAYTKHCPKRDNDLVEILKKNYHLGSRTWIRDTLLEINKEEMKNPDNIPLLLDITDLLPLLNGIIPKKQNRYHARRQFIKIANEMTVYSNKDNEKYKEILEKLLGIEPH